MIQRKYIPTFHSKRIPGFHFKGIPEFHSTWVPRIARMQGGIRMLLVVATFGFMSIGSCLAAKHPKAVMEALSQAGENRKELLGVLDQYAVSPKDSLRYKAACFLLEHMPIHQSRTFYWADSLNRKVAFNEFDHPDFKTAVVRFNQIALKGGLHPVIVTMSDLKTMSAAYLTRNIEQALEAYATPRARNLSFETFCEYLLPYRFMNEQYTEWRDSFSATYSAMAAPHLQKSVRMFSAAMCDSLKGVFYNTYIANASNIEPAFLSPKQMLFRKQGACEDMANWGGYVFRSLGIATAVDYTPAWATSTGSHYWNVTFGEHGEAIPFVMGSTDTPNRYYLHREPSKVLRITYSVQPTTLAQSIDSAQIPEGFLRMSNYIDVTRDYWMVADLPVKLDSTLSDNGTAYVSVLNGLNWRPVWWGKASSAQQVTFTDLSCGVVYLPMSYHNGVLTPAAYPQLLRRDERIEVLKPDTRKPRTIALPQQESYLMFRVGKKYTLYCWYMGGWRTLGTKTAIDTNPLVFSGVPSDALLLLIPEYSAGKERPFTINATGQREWW